MTKKNIYLCLLLCTAGFAIRLLTLQIDAAYQSDVLTFQIWAADLYENGLSHFYGNGFTDYPPAYMYVLYAVGMIRSIFGWGFSSPAFNLLIRLPAFFCDAALGCLFYTFAFQKTNKARTACLIAAAYLFTPSVLLDSAVWGQVDSVYTLLLFISLYFISQKKILPAYLWYGVAILTKPQSLLIGPVFLYSAYTYLSDHLFTRNAVIRLFLYISSALAFMALLALPFTKHFNFMPILQQYFNTLGSYAYGSVNAYNFFALIGGNWAPLTNTFLGVSYTIWGIVFVAAIVLGGLATLHRSRGKQDVFLIAGALNVLVFMFSVKMHERYLYPSLAFFLAAFINTRDKRILTLYTVFSATFFLNCADILRMIKNGNQLSVIQNTQPIISFVNFVLTAVMVYWVIADDVKTQAPIRRDTPAAHTSHTSTNSSPPVMGRMDYTLICALTLIYGLIAFIRLGDTTAPQTTWAPKGGELAIIDLGEVKELSRMQFMMGARHDKAFMVYASIDGHNWDFDYQVTEAAVFAWTDIPINREARYIEVIPFGEGLMIQEVALRDMQSQLLSIAHITPEAVALTDEPYTVPDSANFMNGTYFDEIYHVRTGYEFAHGLAVYENTHPPLGKDLIALSITLLGMTPFAWRLPGTLFGIMMIPLLYAFARQVFNANKWAFFAAFIYTFDFMHFTQTRIATIDTYVTFFVIAMYYFMYRYVKTNRSPDHFLGHSLGLLALCGACMGMAVASKWQGVYGAIGLPLLFFPAWFDLYRENRKNAYLTLLACVALFGLIPALIYGLSYIPFVLASGGSVVETIINNQRSMFWYHSTLVSEHSFSSDWWEWPLILRPMYYYANTVSDTLRQGISSFGNPAVWWTGIAATVYALYALWKKHDYALIFLLVAYAAQYLPWVLVSRTTYIYHYFPSVPFVVLLITYLFKDRFTNRLGWVYGYAGLTAALFVLFYPVLSGLPFSVRFVHTFLRWLPGWVLM